MQIVRTLVWVLLLAALLVFSAFNWNPVEVNIWENLVVDTKIPALVVVSFLIGIVPMWLLHRATKWQLNRRISSLEAAARSASATLADSVPPPPPPSPPPADVQPVDQPLAETLPPAGHESGDGKPPPL